MVATRRLTKAEAAEAVELYEVRIPSYPRPSHPFSRSELPDLYSLRDLGKTSEADGFRLQWFFERLCAIQIIIAGPVPYFFKENGGNLRSLDAGCLGHLNQRPGLLQFNESAGVISSLRVSPDVIEQIAPRIDDIIREMRVDP